MRCFVIKLVSVHKKYLKNKIFNIFLGECVLILGQECSEAEYCCNKNQPDDSCEFLIIPIL